MLFVLSFIKNEPILFTFLQICLQNLLKFYVILSKLIGVIKFIIVISFIYLNLFFLIHIITYLFYILLMSIILRCPMFIWTSVHFLNYS